MCATECKDTLEMLRDTYKEIGQYDRHYSTVRTGVSTFLTVISITIISIVFRGIAFAKPAGENEINILGAVLIIVLICTIFLFAVILNVHFQKLTFSCEKIQLEIEKLFENFKTEDDLKYAKTLLNNRRNISNVYKEYSEIYFDIPLKCLASGIVSFIVIMIFAVKSTDGDTFLLPNEFLGQLPATLEFIIFIIISIFLLYHIMNYRNNYVRCKIKHLSIKKY
jgi:membrane protein YdbS with pleckstrin-like domain